MNNISTVKYRVKNLDCAACAAKIEQRLKEVDEVEEAVLDFANLTLHLKSSDLQKAVAVIRRIEPDVELVPAAAENAFLEEQADVGDPKRIRSIAALSISVVLFGFLMFFESYFHDSQWFWVEYPLALSAYLLAGWNVLAGAARTIRRKSFFDENVLMVIATSGAFAIHAIEEAVGVMLFYKIGEMLQDKAVSRSRRSIRSLLAIRPDHANVQQAGGFRAVPPAEVLVDQIILVKPGEKVPLDGSVLSGESQVDMSPLTGEPMPLSVGPGQEVLAGGINQSGAMLIRVLRPFAQSSISRILELVENAAARKAHTEKFITSFARYYTPGVVFAAAAIALLPPLLVAGATFDTWVYRALVLLVISCPCALVVSIPMGYFGGIGRASRQGILVKGSNFIDALAQIKTVVFDKTGTLTHGVFEVQQVTTSNGYSPDQVLGFAAAAEYYSTHPIAKSIVRAFSLQGGKVDSAQIGEHAAIGGRGARAIVDGHEIIVGNDALLHQKNISHDQCAFEGTVVHVAVDGKHAGHLLIGDRIRAEAAQALSQLRRNGVVQLIMLTGDNECAAEQVSQALDLDRFYSGLLPEDKVAVFESISRDADHQGKVAFVGDGINDAPVLARADVGIAMGGLGSDAAIETADVVLMTDSPAKVAEAIAIARDTRRIVWQNIVMALSVKGIFIIFGAFGLATMWEAVFADMGIALIAVLNATRAFGLKTYIEPHN